MDIKAIQQELREFSQQRDWDQFHSPKNLAAALAVEAAELLELFQWLTEEQSYCISDEEQQRQAVTEELADVLLYLLRLADRLGIDLEAAAAMKIKKNAEKYPVELVKGDATKYNRR